MHAWVMWVELLSVNQNQIRFSLESYGRYRGDKYYVGDLRDAQTGEQITDREMERKLRVLGSNPKGKRHADLAVRALDMIDQSEPLSGERLDGGAADDPQTLPRARTVLAKAGGAGRLGGNRPGRTPNDGPRFGFAV